MATGVHDVSFDTWVTLTRTYLGKRCVKYWKKLLLDAHSVCEGVKPSLLFDYTAATCDALQLCLTAAHNANLLPCPLQVIVVDQDNFIVNMQLFPQFIRTLIDATFIPLVDISGHLSKPVIMDKISAENVAQEICNSVLCQLGGQQGDASNTTTTADAGYKQTNSSILTLYFADHINRSTVFGLLLGFPVVYWYKTDCDDSNCLSMVPLRVFTITIQASTTTMVEWLQWPLRVASVLYGLTDIEHILYSFSIPEELLLNEVSVQTIGKFVEEWWKIRHNVFIMSGISSCKMSCETKTYPCLTL